MDMNTGEKYYTTHPWWLTYNGTANVNRTSTQPTAVLHHMGSKLREVIQELYPLYYPLQVVDGFLGGDTAPGNFT